jgi:DNA-binding NarL/FixJ family response regulator
MGMPTIKVIIADDHPVVRQGLRALLSTEPDLIVVAEAEDGKKAVELARKFNPEIVLMDVAMPRWNGVLATRHILQLSPQCKVLALSTYTDDDAVRRMLQAGAAGYVSKQTAPEELLKAIEQIRAGLTYFSPSIAPLAQRLNDLGSQRCVLDKQEKEVVKFIAEGLTNKQIATRLGLAMPEMKYCRERVMNKLDIHNVAQLTRYALANGLAGLNPPPVDDPASLAPAQPGNCCARVAKSKPLAAKVAQTLASAKPPKADGSPASLGNGVAAELASRLSARERDVLIAVAEGLSTNEIANRLKVGSRTVDTHRENIMRKLKIRSIAGLTRFAIVQKWIGPCESAQPDAHNREGMPVAPTALTAETPTFPNRLAA